MANKEDIGKVGQEGGVNQDDTNSIGRCGLEWQQAAINRSSAKGSYGNVYFLSLYKKMVRAPSQMGMLLL